MAAKKGNLYYSGYSGLTALQVASFLSKTLTTEEQQILNSIISAIELYIAKKCRRNFKYDLGADVYEETFDAGNVKYYFSNFPIKEITKITIDSADVYVKGGNNNQYELNEDFFVYDDYIVFETVIPTSSNNDRQSLKIQYNIDQFWGEDVVLAIKQWAAQIFSQKEYGGKNVSSFNFSGFSLSFSESEIPSYVKEIINSYKKVLI
jgi:hypothetical protein